jgi:hypothetical protein
MASDESKPDEKIYALINYEDPYVQPLILSALENRLPKTAYELITSLSQLPAPSSRLLQFVQYESIDFDHLMEHSSTSLANAYVIRKALIRKHYLSTTIANWITKYPDSVLRKHVKPSVEFEVDYAEFLDDALVEAWELKESWARNAELDNEGEEAGKKREWWILKPGMSDRGQGIRLFSSEEELTSIFEEWDPESDDEDEEEDARSDAGNEHKDGEEEGNGIITAQLRHISTPRSSSNHQTARRRGYGNSTSAHTSSQPAHCKSSSIALCSRSSPHERMSRLGIRYYRRIGRKL